MVKKNTTIESIKNDAPNQVWGCLKVDISGKVKEKNEGKYVEL